LDEPACSAAPDGSSYAAGPISVVGVDPTDRRAVAELPRWVPADATALYRVRPEDRPSAIDVNPATNPPGLLLAVARRLRGTRVDPSTLGESVEAAAGECGVPVRNLEGRPVRPSVPRSRWWTAGAWAVTALGVGALLAAGILLALAGEQVAGGLLVASFSVLLVIGAGARLVGFALAHEAAGIRRADASIAAQIAAGVDPSETRPVVVLPARNAAGVAAVLREHGVDAEARIVAPGSEPDAGP